MEEERKDVISYGRRVPGRDNKHIWIGIHPTILRKERLHKILDSYHRSEATDNVVDGEDEESSDDDDDEEECPFDNEALSITFLKLCEAMYELAAYSTLPALKAHPEAEEMLIVPGMIAAVRVKNDKGHIVVERPCVRDSKTGKNKPVPWLLAFSQEIDEEKKTRTYRDNVASRFVYLARYTPETNVQTLRTTSWLISIDHDQVVKALIDAAYMFTGLIKASSFQMSDAHIPEVDITPLGKTSGEKGEQSHMFTVTWLFTRGHVQDAYTTRQKNMARMTFIKEALVAPPGANIMREEEQIAFDG
jgi:hypothetical protein